jgi:stearoyl-CoA desaturase (Delta-9 desaturase)
MPRHEPAAAGRPTHLDWLMSIPFLAMHAAVVVGLFLVPVSWKGLLLSIVVYYSLMAAVTIGYHRYFSHRSFKTSRAFQFLLALACTMSAQKGVLWWAANHRHHHKYSDQENDIHSPTRRGFWWAHVGWILVSEYAPTRTELVRDWMRFPELRWLNRYHILPVLVLGAVMYLAGGLVALYWGWVVATVMLWHGTFTVNSLAHVWGRRRYQTNDTSRNNLWLALLTLGEGWHNNHHHYQLSARQGFFWWEVDVSFYVLRLWQALGLVWDVRTPPRSVLLADGLPLPL